MGSTGGGCWHVSCDTKSVHFYYMGLGGLDALRDMVPWRPTIRKKFFTFSHSTGSWDIDQLFALNSEHGVVHKK